MIKRLLYLCLLLMMVAACKDEAQEEKRLLPTKMLIGPTKYDFLYDKGRVYSITTYRPGYYDKATYRYYDDFFRKPDHRLKNEVFMIRYEPDLGPRGWDKSDSIKYKVVTILERSESDLVSYEAQNVFLHPLSIGDFARHTYDKDKHLVASTHFYYNTLLYDKSINMEADPRYISKRVTYDYKDGKLSKAAYYGAVSKEPYLVVELKYDDKPGYLKHLPREARFLPLELPYRDHNITSYILKERYGKVRKDLSYTCTYTYNRDGYPKEFTRKMLNGKEEKGYIVYKTGVGVVPVRDSKPSSHDAIVKK